MSTRRLCRIVADNEVALMELADWIVEQAVTTKPEGGAKLALVMPRWQLDEAAAHALCRIMDSRGMPVHITLK